MTTQRFGFQLLSTDGAARRGQITTLHGEAQTPLFMPVATQATVKGLTFDEVRSLGAETVLSNAYHLYLRPGVERVRNAGGLHRFMGWDGPILTDSGGYQAFSMGTLRRVNDDGIVFRSHIDGSEHFFTPESAIINQHGIGADIIMCFDQCVFSAVEPGAVRDAMERTHRWAQVCHDTHVRSERSGKQALFGIVQGGISPELRERSAEAITSLGFPGYALGGLSVGESKDEMYRMTALATAMLPADSPRYLMGVGSPEDLVESVARGVDMFDCVLPTRIARNGALFSRSGRINIYAAPHRDRDEPIEPGCDCYVCQNFSAAYIHHLFKSKELLAYRLATLHNLRFILRMMEEMREAIFAGTFQQYRADFHRRFTPPDQRARHEQRQKWLASQGRPGA